MKLDEERLKEVLRQELERMGLSQRQFHQRFIAPLLSQPQVNKILNGNHPMNLPMFLAICKLANRPLDEFVFTKNPPSPLVQRIRKINPLMRDPRFPFGENTAMEMFADLVDKMYSKAYGDRDQLPLSNAVGKP